MKIIITNKSHGRQTPNAATYYVGRGSPLGNPFSSKTDTKAIYSARSRSESIALYEQWLEQQIENENPSVMSALAEIQGGLLKYGHVYLECFCSPKDCHADIIKEILEESSLL